MEAGKVLGFCRYRLRDSDFNILGLDLSKIFYSVVIVLNAEDN
jgi:hypothetical protein